MPASQKIAFATDDVRQVNQPFGSAKTFAVYAVDPNRAELLSAAQFGISHAHDTLAAKIELLDGCAAVYCESIGASAIQQLIASGIQPVKVYRGAQIAELINDFQNEKTSGTTASTADALMRNPEPGALP